MTVPASASAPDSAAPSRPLRVAVVEDQPLYRQMLVALLHPYPGFDVVAERGDATSASELDVHAFDLAIVDVQLGDGDGIELGRAWHRLRPGLPIVLLSAVDRLDALLRLSDAERAGWSYLSKNSALSARDLMATLRRAAGGASVIDSALVARRRARTGGRLAVLTSRQFEVLARIAEGFSNRAIAQELGLSERSVDNHVNGIYAALELSRGDAYNPRVRAVRLFLTETA